MIEKASKQAYHVAIASDEHNYIHSVGINPSLEENPEKRKKLGVIESCLKDCATEHERHDPYQAKKAVGYVVMRLKGTTETLPEE